MYKQNRFFLVLTACGLAIASVVGCGDPEHIPETCPSGTCDGEPSSGAGAHTEPEANTENRVDYEGFTVAPPPGPGEPGHGTRNFEDKMNTLVESAEVPSALAGAFFQVARAYLSGREPITQIEVSAFAILDEASPEVLDAFARTIERIDELPSEDMTKLYAAEFIQARANDPLTHSHVRSALVTEIATRVALAEFGEADPEILLGEEEAGLVREGYCFDRGDGGAPGPCPNVCSFKVPSLAHSLRTSGYVPHLTAGAYDLTELQRTCIVDPKNPRDLHCPPETVNCKGDRGGSNEVCLAVPPVMRGEAVMLYGFNFHDVDARVHLSSTGSEIVRKVDAHVRGDNSTPADGPGDCQTSDHVTFQIPEDLPMGIYAVQVEVADPGPHNYTFLSNMAYLQVLPPTTSRFSFYSDELLCIDRDGSDYSDEVGLKVITVHLNDGEAAELPSIDFEFESVDSGDRFDLGRVHFSDTVGRGVGFTILGYEIDDREAYKKQIKSASETYELVMKGMWGDVAKGVEGLGAGIGSIWGPGGTAIGTAIGKVVGAAIVRGVMVWAPPDLLIEDSGGFTFIDVASLTSRNILNPPEETKRTEGGIDVVVGPAERTKLEGFYRERRQYNQGTVDVCPPGSSFYCNADRMGSKYQLTFEYSRID